MRKPSSSVHRQQTRSGMIGSSSPSGSLTAADPPAIDHSAVTSAYRRYAPFYNLLFGALFEPGRKQVARALSLRAGETVLEVGVGTGLSLPLYPRNVRVTGIDISPHMLAQAERRVARHALDNVRLLNMDAQQLSFPDRSFDHVVALYVVSVVPDPAVMMRELERVCRPGGEIVVVNHFTREAGLAAHLERGLAPLARQLGFRPHFPLERFKALTRFELVEQSRVNAFGYWTLLRFRLPVG